MLDKGLKGLLAALAAMTMLAMVAIVANAANSTACDKTGLAWPGRLCATIASNTSTPAPARAGPRPAQEHVLARTLPAESAQVQTLPGAPLEAVRGSDIRIALMLPLRSDTLGAPADALRAGFMAAYQRDPAGFIVNLIETDDSTEDTLSTYTAAIEHNDLVVGPLARSAVSALAASTLVRKFTIALNQPEARIRDVKMSLPPQLLVMGLSIEAEARQVADWAAAEHPGGAAMIIVGASAWQRRIATSFAARWRQLGQSAQLVELTDAADTLSEAALDQLRNQADGQMPVLLFAALDAGQTAQVRGALDANLPVYGTSSVNPGTALDVGQGVERDTIMAHLNGLRLLDLPWEVQPRHQAVMTYPRWNSSARTLDMDRLYALGIDAFRVARELALRPGANFQLDGVTGRLSVRFSGNDGAARFERIQPAVVYQDGAFTLVPRLPLLPQRR